MDARILVGYRITWEDTCHEECSHLADIQQLHYALLQLKPLPSALSIFLTDRLTIYVGLEMPSAYNEMADLTLDTTLVEQLKCISTDEMPWNTWFDAYHILHGQKIAVEDGNVFTIKCQNETPCIFSAVNVTTVSMPRTVPLPIVERSLVEALKHHCDG